MSQAGVRTLVSSVDGTNFTAAILVNAVGMAALSVPGRTATGIVRALTIESAVANAWEINFFGTAAGVNADPNVEVFLGRHAFIVADGLQIGATGLFRYYIGGLDIRVSDGDNGNDLHVGLVPRNAGKALDETFQVGIVLEAMGAWG